MKTIYSIARRVVAGTVRDAPALKNRHAASFGLIEPQE